MRATQIHGIALQASIGSHAQQVEWVPATTPGQSIKALFSFHQKLFTLSHRMFEHMYKALNVDKKIITQFA
jgi:hypothetical protein